MPRYSGSSSGGSSDASASGGSRYGNVLEKARPTKKKKDDGGIKLPKFGLGQLARELGGIPAGLARIAVSAAPGGQKSMLPDFGRGVAGSVAGTVATVADAATMGKGGGPIRSLAAGALGEEFRPQTASQMVSERGILPALVENVGNVALGAGAVGKLAKAGRTGKAANAAVTAERATKVATLKPGTGAAARAGRVAEKAAAKAPAEGVVPAAKVASRAKAVRGAYTASHPYVSLFEDALRPVTKAAQAKVVSRAGGEAPVAAPEPLDVHPAVQSYHSQYGAAQGATAPRGVAKDVTALPEDVGERVRQVYNDEGFHRPDDPGVQAAYSKFVTETEAMAEHMAKPEAEGGLGITVEYVDRDSNPYSQAGDVEAQAAAMMADVEQNKHLYVDKTPPEEGHPVMTPEQNDRFRGVHDFFGHYVSQRSFDRHGEESAYKHHAQMYSPEARRALATETRGQNNVLIREGQFPAQKAGLLPEDLADPELGNKPEPRPALTPGSPTEEWAARVAERMGDRLLGAASYAEGKFQGRETKAAYNYQRRQQEGQRRVAIRQAESSIGAAVSLLEEQRKQAGDPIGRDAASTMVGAWLTRELTGQNLLSEELASKHSDAVLAEAGALQSPIPPELFTPELEAQLKAAAEDWRPLREQAEATLRASGRLGEKGLEGADELRWTKTEKRALQQYQLDEKRLVRLAARREREAARVEKIVARLDDQTARRAEQIDNLRKQEGYAQRTFDESRMPKGLPRDPAAWEAFAAATLENEGGTFDPHTGPILPARYGGDKTGWASSILDVETMPSARFAEVNPVTGNTLGAELIHRAALDFQDLIAENPDVRIGVWHNPEDGLAYVDMSQHTVGGRPMSRDQALLVGAARKQQSIMDFSSETDLIPTGRPDVAAQFVGRELAWSRPTHRQSRANELRKVADEQGLFTHEEVDALMNATDVAAVVAHRAGKVAHPDDYYSKWKAKFSTKAPSAHALFQNLFSGNMRDTWNAAKTAIPDLEKQGRWYYDVHDSFQTLFGDREFTLLDGTQINGADLAYQIMAVTSINASVNINLKNTLQGLSNIDRFVSEMSGNATEVQRLMRQFERARGQGKTDTALFKELTFATHIYAGGETKGGRKTVPVARQAVFDILSGRTLDTWDEDYFMSQRQELWGQEAKSLSMKNVPQELIDKLGPERARMEYHGSKAWAKIRSYWRNLADPENSIDVTLDTWMSRLFEGHDKMWEKTGNYSKHAEIIREWADTLTQETGTTVRPHEVQAALWFYAMKTIQEEELAAARAAGDKGKVRSALIHLGLKTTLPQIMAEPTGAMMRLFDELGVTRGVGPMEALLQKMNEDIKGELLIPEDGGVMGMRFFKTGDASTLVHEHGHVIRQALSKEHLATLERAYGVTDHAWTVAAEERFADDFLRYLAERDTAGRTHLGGAFKIMEGLLSEEWRHLRGHLLKETLSPEARSVLDDLLDPPEGEINDLGIPGIREAELTVRQRAQIVPKLGEAAPAMYRRGIKGGKAIGDIERIGREIARKTEAQGRAQRVRTDMLKAITEGTLPSEIQAAALSKKMDARMAKLTNSLDNPSLAQVPAVWKPLWGAVQELTKAAEGSPELARELEGMPKTFSDVLKFASERGFDPVHVRSFTNSEVENLVFASVRLGKRGRDLGQTITAGTRKSRRNAFAREQSIEALVAAQVEVAHEANTNALVDHVESNWAKPVPENGAIPKGWIPWDPERAFILTGERTPDGGVTVGSGTAVGRPRFMVPEPVRKSLAAFEKDYAHWATRALGKITNPWRALILTWTPRWYVNNFIGNTVLATAEGVKLQDWKRAWESYKAGNFKDTPGVTGASMVADMGEDTLIPRSGGRAGIREASADGRHFGGRTGQVGETYRQVAHQVQRANAVVDEMARAAVYHKGVRSGLSPEAALQRSFTALVDYNDLTPFERQIVKSVLPFYAWQKGILKLVARFPIDHPAGAAVAMQLGLLNQRRADENDLPEAYQGLIKLPGLGSVNTRGFNPFQDSAQLTSPQGIAASINPFVELGLRNALGAPEGGFVKHQRLNEFGLAVPDTSPGQDLAGILSSLPQARLGGSLSGRTAPGQPGAAQGALRFLGLPSYDDEQVARIQSRLRKQRRRVS